MSVILNFWGPSGQPFDLEALDPSSLWRSDSIRSNTDNGIYE